MSSLLEALKGASKEEFAEAIGQLQVIQLAEFADALKEKFGVTAMAPVAAAGAAAGPAVEVEEQTEFTAVLKDIGPNKINVIKVVREVTSLGLKEAKQLVEEAPKPIKEGIPKEEAQKIKAKMEEVGATVEIK